MMVQSNGFGDGGGGVEVEKKRVYGVYMESEEGVIKIKWLSSSWWSVCDNNVNNSSGDWLFI